MQEDGDDYDEADSKEIETEEISYQEDIMKNAMSRQSTVIDNVFRSLHSIYSLFKIASFPENILNDTRRLVSLFYFYHPIPSLTAKEWSIITLVLLHLVFNRPQNRPYLHYFPVNNNHDYIAFLATKEITEFGLSTLVEIITDPI